ncbi:Flp pilus assembly complex ATPase component TadA [Fructilactobacillus myrtifloralis]|uniref:Flp pilus assembly complex ATPase component TadA n=1 Tax=Fructilactobacillus myrtifloralis TaxID=2940301 RepID=A0ABY5BNE7_9LACO|nr:competence type IV pilus ATPase ComGA [Fructilactobacillus myrtifloralis]USS85200.1 Flp pilus assembly complex ATPase component TadA [Fructilactobacillus myrtifloralis]
MEIKQLFHEIMTLALAKQASDVYFLPKRDNYEVKMHTLQGALQLSNLDNETARRLLTYCKYRGGLSIAERRRPQLGSLDLPVDKQLIRLRLATVGSFNQQEALVLRIIYDGQAHHCQFFNPEVLPQLKRLTSSRGLFLFAGPTGSGKTTTIYELARSLPETEMVMAIEDPVEIFEERFLQLEVNDAAGMSYGQLLKVGLRQRPDVFIIGEIRDRKTAQIAIRAALSGHLVLSTIHAQNLAGIKARLLDLKVSEDQYQAALTAVVYQRLLPTCNQETRALLAWQSQPAPQSGSSWELELNRIQKQGMITNECYEAFKQG